MPEFWIAVDGVAMGLLGAVVSLWQPKETQFKIASITGFGVLSIVLVVLIWFKVTDDNAEKAKAVQLQKDTQEIALQTQRAFRGFRQEVVDARKNADNPGSAEDKLNATIESLNKALGRSSTASAPTPPPAQLVNTSNAPINFNRTAGFTGTQQLSALMKREGYAGQMLLFMLEICNPAENTEDFFVGQADVSPQNGFKYESGMCNTLWNQDASQLYLFSLKPNRVTLSATSK